MHERFERLIDKLYRRYRLNQPCPQGPHPTEEEAVCFLEGALTEAEAVRFKAHVVRCASCAESLSLQFKLKQVEDKEPPETLLRYAKGLVSGRAASPAMHALDVLIRIKENALVLLETTGDFIVGQELVSAQLLRSRSIKDFKDEVVILKDFGTIRLEMKVENKRGKAFDLGISIKDTQTLRAVKDVRVTLMQGEVELESRLAEGGKVTFEHVLIGKYALEVAAPDNRLASVSLEIKQ